MTSQIDLNADLGEAYGPWDMGDDIAMLSVVTSANVACGGHASDPQTMFRTLTRAKENGVVVGAHPGYADREGFGRRVIPMALDEIGRMVAAQVGALQGVAKLAGVEVVYFKAHGALSNHAARNLDVAQAVVGAVEAMGDGLAILAVSGTQLEVAARKTSLPVYSEIFADRGYLTTGQLVPRDQPGAMIHDAGEAAERLLGYLETGLMPTVDGDPVALDGDSICVHGDSAGAVAMAQEVRRRLKAEGVQVRPFLR